MKNKQFMITNEQNSDKPKIVYELHSLRYW